MFDKHTDRTRKIMELANEEARRFNHEYIGTEHLLLGLVEVGHGVGVNVLGNLGVDKDNVRLEVEKLVKPGPDKVAPGKLPQTPRAKQVIKHAGEESRELNHRYVGSEHLLLGLLHERDGVAAQVLINLGLKPAKVRGEVFRLLGITIDSEESDNHDSHEESAVSEAENAQATEYVKKLFKDAIDRRGVDIHLSPTKDGRGRVRLRVDGVLCDTDLPVQELYPAIAKQIKCMAAMDISEQQIAQTGRGSIEVAGKTYDLRVNVVPTMRGERFLIRILSAEKICLSLDEMGFADKTVSTIRQLSHLPNGIIICNGLTGSGKTTLLYAMLMEVDRDKCCVMSVEDPVEYDLPGVDQIQVDRQRGLSFTRAIRNILRQDPDVIMVGEIRDLETAQLCVQCGLTGHLVMTQLHAETSPEAIKRLIDLGIQPYLVKDTVRGIISQRLVRVLCPQCKQQTDLKTDSLPSEAVEFLRTVDSKAFYSAKGCEDCHGTGYHRRTAIHEILIMNDQIRALVSDSMDVTAVQNSACQTGMQTLLMNGLEKAALGITSIEEILRVVPQ